tara:strand:+ start:1244 stop:2227 length:984 start_codon:yes stop_codon:yes gene_type:complete
MKKNIKFTNDCLIGYSGTIGKHLCGKAKFKHKYNSKNIEKIINKKFKMIICCAAPGAMTIANRKPNEDLKNIKKLIKYLKLVKTEKFILISTIQVFSILDKKNNDEDSNDLNNKLAYGKNRRILEKFCQKQFKNHLVIRLPSLFGKHIKKNFIFDIINPMPTFLNIKKIQLISKILPTEIRNFFTTIYRKKDDNYYIDRNLFNKSTQKNILIKYFEKYNFVSSSLTNPNSKYQYYNLENLIKDIKIVYKLGVKYLNISTEPIHAKNIYQFLTKKKMKSNNAKIYSANMVSKYAKLWGDEKNYLYTKKIILNDLKKFYKIKKNESINF